MASEHGRLDLVLVHPGSRGKIYQGLGTELSGIEPPIWAAMIATFIRKHDYSVAIVDAEAENLDSEEVADRIVEMDPVLATVVVYGHTPNASTQNMTVAGEICTSLRQKAPEQNTLLLGGHVSALPERTLREEDANFVAGGEGPYTVLDLLQALKSSRPDFSKVRSLWYKENGDVRQNPPAPMLSDLDNEMPGLAWDLLPMDKYRAHNWHCFGDLERQPYAAIYTTLGCPYHCTFCCIQAPFKSGEKASGFKDSVNSYRFWSIESVMKQIDTVVNEYGIRNLRISDEMFVLNERHVHGICDAIIDRGYNLNIWAYARVDTVRGERTVDKLKRAGFNWLCFGIEAASERVRADVQKSFSQDLAYQTIAKARAGGINVNANFIFGLPEDDYETMQQTLDMALELNCEFANLYSTMPYPGSQLYNIAVEKGWPLPEKWSGFSQHSVDTLPLPTKYISGPDVLRFRDEAWQTYHTNPKYLEMIKRKFGDATVKHIEDMTSYKMVRNHVGS